MVLLRNLNVVLLKFLEEIQLLLIKDFLLEFFFDNLMIYFRTIFGYLVLKFGLITL